MPKGGARPNTGPKPKTRAVGRAATQSEPLPLPATLSGAAAAYWTQWSPLACDLGTLVPASAPGFTLLCQVAAEVDDLRAVLTAAGWLDLEGRPHPLSASYRNHVLRLEQLQARYGLAAAGKPVAVPGTPERDPLDEWAGGVLTSGTPPDRAGDLH